MYLRDLSCQCSSLSVRGHSHCEHSAEQTIKYRLGEVRSNPAYAYNYRNKPLQRAQILKQLKGWIACLCRWGGFRTIRNRMLVSTLTLAMTGRLHANAAGALLKIRYLPIHSFTPKIPAFTLAEVLITLGIIGIVAAMTLPALIQRNNNKITEVRLKRFYTAINQAVLMAEAEYEDRKYWFEDLKGAELDADGKPVKGSSPAEKWFNKYLGKHLPILHSKLLDNGSFIVYFTDGSALRTINQYNTRDWTFYPKSADKCIEKYGLTGVGGAGICAFPFNFMPRISETSTPATRENWKFHIKKGFEPWKYKWDGSREQLLEGCKKQTGGADNPPSPYFCTALIQYDNWTISPDYPKKVSY